MTKISSSHHDFSIEFEDAILSELRGEIDFDGRSQADFLIDKIQSSPHERSRFAEAAVKLLNAVDSGKFGWWVTFERVVSIAGLESGALGEGLERVLLENSSIVGDDRACIYSLMDICEKPQPAYIIKNDDVLMTTAPIRWLDLLILRIPVLEDVQELVLQAINCRDFGLKEFTHRLEEMRAIGGTKLGDWLRAVRSALPDNETDAYDRLVDQAFGLDGQATTSQPETINEREIQALADIVIARLGQLIRNGDVSAMQRKMARSKPTAGRTRKGHHQDETLTSDSYRGAALNIERIQQTKQLAKMSA